MLLVREETCVKRLYRRALAAVAIAAVFSVGACSSSTGPGDEVLSPALNEAEPYKKLTHPEGLPGAVQFPEPEPSLVFPLQPYEPVPAPSKSIAGFEMFGEAPPESTYDPHEGREEDLVEQEFFGEKYVEDLAISRTAIGVVEEVLTVDALTDAQPQDAVERVRDRLRLTYSYLPSWRWNGFGGWQEMVRLGARSQVIKVEDVTEGAIRADDTLTKGLRTIQVDLLIVPETGKRILIEGIIVYCSLQRDSVAIGAPDLGPWVMKDAWEAR